MVQVPTTQPHSPVLPPKPPKRHRGLKVLGGIVAAGACIGIGAGIGSASHPKPAAVTKTVVKAGPTDYITTPGPTVTATVTAAPAVAGATMPGDGTFVVGTAAGDWAPGTWQSGTPSSGNCYSATLSNLSGTGASSGIINNNNSTGPSVMTVDPGDAGVQVSGCATWHKIG
jgi:hypothetical protein